jgi:hypothetical protein
MMAKPSTPLSSRQAWRPVAIRLRAPATAVGSVAVIVVVAMLVLAVVVIVMVLAELLILIVRASFWAARRYYWRGASRS